MRSPSVAVLVMVLAAAGCTVDVCGGFSGQSCIAVEAHGPAVIVVDHLRIDGSGAFTLTDQPSPTSPRASGASLPIAVAVLPGPVSGTFTLTLRAQLDGAEVARGTASGTLTSGKTTRITVELVPEGVIGGDLSQPRDLAHPVDLAGRDLAGVQCDPVSQQPCPSDQKCLLLSSAVCRPNGTTAIGQTCSADPDDDCVRGSQCLFPGDLTPGNGVCEQFCAAEGDCHQPPVSVGGTALPANGPHCLFSFSGSGPPLLCSVACNPVSSQGTSGCPTGSVCVYGSNSMFPEFTFCDRAATGTDGQACDANSRCAPGFNCVEVGTDTRCRAMCRAGNNGDCGTLVCKPGAGGSPPMFGFCCPSAGC